MSVSFRSSVFYTYDIGYMSASESLHQEYKTPHNSRMVDLPPEIWIDIFDFATHIPGLLTIDNVTDLEAYAEDEDGIILHDLYHESMRVKLAISCVSKSWRRLVTPLLFRCLLIHSGSHARIISNALSCFRSSQSSEKFVGKWIKRIEIAVEHGYWEEDSLLALTNILDCAPNLLVFSDFHNTARVPEGNLAQNVVRKLRQLCIEGSLRRLEWSGPSCFPLEDLLDDAPSLEVLMTKQTSVKLVSLPKLRTLVVRNAKPVDKLALLSAGSPKLHSLISFAETKRTSDPLSPSFPQLFSQYSVFPSLKHLHCVLPPNKNISDLIQTMSSLSTLTLDFVLETRSRNLDRYLIQLPNTRRINLQNFPPLRAQYGQRPDAQALRSAYDFLWNLIDRRNNASLQTIGFHISRGYFDDEDFELPENLATSDGFWEAFISQCNKQNIKLEASVGVVDHVLSNWYPFHLGLVPHNLLVDQ